MAARPFLRHTLVTASCWQAKLSEGLAHTVFVTTSSRRLGEEMGAAKLLSPGKRHDGNTAKKRSLPNRPSRAPDYPTGQGTDLN